MSVEEILNIIFGGQVDISKITTILVAVWGVVMSIFEWRAKKKLLKADAEATRQELEIKNQEKEIKNLETCVSKLCDVVLTAYLTSNTVPEETKRTISVIGSELNKVAEIPLTEQTNKLIAAVSQIIPETINEKKEEILEHTQKVEETIDKVNNVAQEAINKIKLS